MAEIAALQRTAVVHHGRRLEYFTIAWNALEVWWPSSQVQLPAAISLVGFGIDSFMEVTSGSVLLWRMSVDADVLRREQNERRALRVVASASCFWPPTSPTSLLRIYGPSEPPNTALRE